MTGDSDWNELVDRHLHGELTEIEKERLAEQLDSDSARRRDFVEQALWDTQLAEALREPGGEGLPPDSGADRLEDVALATRREPARPWPSKSQAVALAAVAAVILVVVSAGLYLLRAPGEQSVATITGLSGSLIWTGDGGRVSRDLSVGTALAGGTVEGMAPDSWAELEFNDGSTLTISGTSMLTFSDQGQKELHLKAGNVSGNVKPQPPGKPMLIHTRSAMLEVMGTQFDVEAGLASTTLRVSEGRVRVKRLSDGNTVDVPARHRVVAAADRDMSPERVPDSVNSWKSALSLGPDRVFGQWSPETARQTASLKAIPFIPPDAPHLTLYLLSLPVSRADGSPVIVQPGSRFVIRGRMAKAAWLFFGIQMAHPDGEFAGKFRASEPASELRDDADFEAVMHAGEFELDPSVEALRSQLPASPVGLVVTRVWCFTPHELAGTAELEITEVELIPEGAAR